MNELTNAKINVNFTAPQIECNFDEMREAINAIVAQYKGYVIQSENEVANAKKIVASLNNTEKSISDQRISIVKEISKPTNAFETAIKAMCAEIHAVSVSISSQVKVYEEAEKERKRQEILSLPDYAEYIVFDEKWLNKTYDIETVKNDLNAQKTAFQMNCKTITAFAEMISLDPADYLAALASGKKIDEIIATMKHDHELLSRNAQATKETPEIIVDTDTTIFTRIWRVKGTKTQLTAVKDFFEKIGVQYEKIEMK